MNKLEIIGMGFAKMAYIWGVTFLIAVMLIAAGMVLHVFISGDLACNRKLWKRIENKIWNS